MILKVIEIYIPKILFGIIENSNFIFGCENIVLTKFLTVQWNMKNLPFFKNANAHVILENQII